VNNWTKILGNHSAKFGADFRYARNLRVPSDTNRAGVLSFGTGPTSNPADPVAAGGIGFATFLLGDTTALGRYASTSTNAKEFQKRLFFYGQDTWRASPNLTINAGLRWELYFPETVNAKGNGSLMDMSTGYLHVAGYGNVPSDMGWDVAWKALAPRIGIAYQLNPKTVIRAGYGRSFDIGVFGSIFGHTATQNLPVLTNQSISTTAGPTAYAFKLQNGPGVPPVTAVPANGLLANPGYAVNSKARPNPLRLPTLDAWNLSLQRSITPTLSVTLAYVGNKGTHTLGAGDSNSTNPNEAALFLPAAYSVTGQTLHWDNTVTSGISPNGGTSNSTYLQRYYGGTLAACQDPTYIATATAAGAVLPRPGACGWTQGIQYDSDNMDTHYNALQVTVEKQFSHGVSFTSNYAWQRSINFNSGYSTWNRTAVKGRDDSNREHSEVAYGTWQLPFGRNQRFGSNVSGLVDEVIGGWSLSPVVDYASGVPFTLNYSGCNSSVGNSSAPCYVNGDSRNLKLTIGKLDPVKHRRLGYHGATVPLTQAPFSNLSAPGLDEIGTAGRNGKFGPNFFNTDLSVQKNFPIHQSLLAQFRMDAYNVFNHMNLPNPGGTIDQGDQYITNLAFSNYPTRQLQLSARFQF
jgi:outer membrane receptor protein involved in Fe transport